VRPGPRHVRRARRPPARGARRASRRRVRDPRPALGPRARRSRGAPRRGSRRMILLSPLRADPAAPLAQANPLAKLGAAAVVMLVLFLSVDPVTPILMLGAIAV